MQSKYFTVEELRWIIIVLIIFKKNFQFRNVQTIFSRHCALLGQIRIEITEEVQVQIVEAEDA